MLTKNNNNTLFQNKKKNENINLHSDCIIQMNNFHDKLLKEKSNYIVLDNKYKELKTKYDILEKENKEKDKKIEKLETEVGELLSWKNNHMCNNYIDIKQILKHIDVKNINDNYNDKILKSETNLKNIELKIQEDKYCNNILSLKESTGLLEKTISEQNKTNEYLQKDKKVIINNNKTNKEIYSLENLYNSIVIYKPNLLSHNFYGSKTYFNLKYYKKLDQLINDDKCDYKEFENWIDLSEEEFLKLKNKKSNYLKNKLKRCIFIFNKYENKLIYIKFNLSYIAKMNNTIYKEWLNILQEKINQNNIKIEDNNIINNIIETVYFIKGNKENLQENNFKPR
jgi:hypothetical protein